MSVQSGVKPRRVAGVRLAILGRDGVINERLTAGVCSVDEWRAIPGSLRAIARLTSAHFHLVVATNQAGVAAGALDGGMLAHIHTKMNNEVAREGGRIEAIFYCPHGIGDGCACRKPKPGLLLELAKRLDIELGGIPFIGDSPDDVAAARAVGARAIMVRAGYGKVAEDSASGIDGVEIYDDLAAAASVLIGQQELD